MSENLLLLFVGLVGIFVGFGAALFLFLLAYRTAQYNYEEKKLEMKSREEGFRPATAETAEETKSEVAEKSSSL